MEDTNMGGAPSAINHASSTEESDAIRASITSLRGSAARNAAKYENNQSTFTVEGNVATFTGKIDEHEILAAFNVAKVIPEVTAFQFTINNDDLRVFEALSQIEADNTTHLRSAGKVYRSPYVIVDSVIGKTTFRRTAMKVW